MQMKRGGVEKDRHYDMEIKGWMEKVHYVQSKRADR